MFFGNITQSVSRTLRSAGRQAYHYGHFLLSSSAYKAPKAVEIQLRSVALPLLTGSLLLYNYGEEQTHPHGDTKRWFRLLTDSTIAFLMLDWAKGLYPIAGVITGAYRAGKAGDTMMDKLREMINTASTFVAGWFGVYLGRNLLIEPATDVDEMALQSLLTEKIKNRTLIEALKQSRDPKVRILGRDLRWLNTLLDKLRKDFKSKKIEGQKYRRFREVIEKLKENSYAKIQDLSQTGKLRQVFPVEGELTPVWQKLVRQMKLSQEWYVKFSRTVNPVCCFLLAATFVGTPLALSTNKLVEKLFPKLKHTPVPKMFPLPGSFLRGPRKPHGASHGEGHELPSSGIETPSLYINGVGTLH